METGSAGNLQGAAMKCAEKRADPTVDVIVVSRHRGLEGLTVRAEP
jgi:hypothetical protein